MTFRKNECGMTAAEIGSLLEQKFADRIKTKKLDVADPYVVVEPADLREGMTLHLRWTDATDKFGDYNLPVFGPPSARG